jgi:hypothetical protein
MKKLFFGLIATVVFGNLSFGQDKNFVNDKDFIEYVKKEFKFYGNVKDKELLKKLSESNIKDWNEESTTLLAKAFGLSDDELQKHILSQNKMLQTLNSRYHIDRLTSEEISDILVANPTNFDLPQNETQSWGCTALYWGCSAGAFALAVLAEAGCAALDVETLGAARVAGCYGAVVVAFGAAIMGCQHARDECEKN